MFGCMDGVVKVELTSTINKDVLAMYVEDRGEDWAITYYVFADYVEVVEYMDGNPEHCVEKAVTLEEAVAIAAKWC